MTAHVTGYARATGSAAISAVNGATITADGDSNLLNVLVTFDAAPTTSELLKVIKTVTGGSAMTLYSIDPSTGSDIDEQFFNHVLIQEGDIITVTYTNTDAKTYVVEIITGES